MSHILFITGTDTGVGKTVLTSLLLTHLRARGCRCRAMKPFCSGGRRDVSILFRALDREVPMKRLNPFYFPQPVAPLVGARLAGIQIPRSVVLRKIREMASECELLLVEGAGGLLVPLGENYTFADIVAELEPPVLLVARNKLGAVNHTLLTLQALRALGVPHVRIALMEAPESSLAAQTNAQLIRHFARPTKVFEVPFLGRNPTAFGALKKNEKKIKKTLARLVGKGMFSPAS